MAVEHRQLFPIRSWVDLHHVCGSSVWKALHFRDYRNYFCLLLTLSNSTFLISHIPGTFHLRQWPLSSPCCLASKGFLFVLLKFDLNLALTWKADGCLH